MVPRARTTQRWPLRPWRSQRKMYEVIYRGALRRRIRRLVGSRAFNNARTATRNLDLPLAIGDPIATQLFLPYRRILASAWRPQRRAFCHRNCHRATQHQCKREGTRRRAETRKAQPNQAKRYGEGQGNTPQRGLANRRLQPLGHSSVAAGYAPRCAGPQAADCRRAFSGQNSPVTPLSFT